MASSRYRDSKRPDVHHELAGSTAVTGTGVLAVAVPMASGGIPEGAAT